MTTWVQGIDASFDRLTPDIAQQLRAAGQQVFMQCLWTGSQAPRWRVENLQVARDAGFPFLLAYISLAGDVPGEWHVDQGRRGVPDDLWGELVLAPIDVELAGIPNGRIREAVDATAGMGRGRSIYTSYGQWTGRQGNDATFGDCYLFNAMWDGDPDVDFGRLPYGGWTEDRVVCEQYQGDTTLAGFAVDRNVFNLELLEAIMGDVNRAEFELVKDVAVKAYGVAAEIARAFLGHIEGGGNGAPPDVTALRAKVDALEAKVQQAGAVLNPPAGGS